MSDVYDLMNSLEEKMEKAFQRADRSAIQRAVIKAGQPQQEQSKNITP